MNQFSPLNPASSAECYCVAYHLGSAAARLAGVEYALVSTYCFGCNRGHWSFLDAKVHSANPTDALSATRTLSCDARQLAETLSEVEDRIVASGIELSTVLQVENVYNVGPLPQSKFWGETELDIPQRVQMWLILIQRALNESSASSDSSVANYVRFRAFMDIDAFGGPAIDALGTTLSSGTDESHRAEAALMLGELGYTHSLRDLRAAADNDSSANVRNRANEAISKFRPAHESTPEPIPREPSAPGDTGRRARSKKWWQFWRSTN